MNTRKIDNNDELDGADSGISGVEPSGCTAIKKVKLSLCRP
jgi:hypothetical protein